MNQESLLMAEGPEGRSPPWQEQKGDWCQGHQGTDEYMLELKKLNLDAGPKNPTEQFICLNKTLFSRRLGSQTTIQEAQVYILAKSFLDFQNHCSANLSEATLNCSDSLAAHASAQVCTRVGQRIPVDVHTVVLWRHRRGKKKTGLL